MILPLLIVQEPPSAGPLLSKMLARYIGAPKLSVQVVTRQSAAGASVTTVSELQFERPAKLRLAQRRDGSQGGRSLLVSNGEVFSYDRPEGQFGVERYKEKVVQNSVAQEIADLYIAGKTSLVEPSPALDLLLGSKPDIQALRLLWSRLTIAEDVTLRDKPAKRVVGQFRLSVGRAFAGEVEMVVTEEGELLRYATKQRVARPPGSAGPPIDVVTTYDVTAVAFDPALFRVD